MKWSLTASQSFFFKYRLLSEININNCTKLIEDYHSVKKNIGNKIAHIYPFGLVVKYNFKYNFSQLNLSNDVIIQVCKSKYILYSVLNIKKTIKSFGGIEPKT